MATTETPTADDDDRGRAWLDEECPLAKLHRKRVAQNRDLTVLCADWNLERGSGKSTLALQLADAFDRTDAGLTREKCTLSAEALTDAYTSRPSGSSLVLDEAEAAASNRRSMSGINEALRQIIGMGRVEQKYLFLTTPGVHQVDRDVRNMCDVWIFVREVGEAQMFRVGYNPIGNHEVTHNWGTIRWPADLPGDLSTIYDGLTREKRRRLRGEGTDGQGFVEAERVEEAAEEARKEAKKETRDEMLRTIYENNDDMTQRELAESVGLSRSHLANILSERR